MPPALSLEQARARRLLEEHTAALQLAAFKLCRDRDQANDLVQDTLERALRREAQLAQILNLHAWLATILHRLFIDRCRASRRRPQVAVEDESLPSPDPSSPPVWSTISEQDLHAAIARLEPGFRAVFELHSRENASYAEISSRLGIPKNTVGTRLARARAKLRALLGGGARTGEEGIP